MLSGLATEKTFIKGFKMKNGESTKKCVTTAENLEKKKGTFAKGKGKTVFDLKETLPTLGVPIDEAIEQATYDAVKERA